MCNYYDWLYFLDEADNVITKVQVTAAKFYEDIYISTERRIGRETRMPGEMACNVGLSWDQEIHRDHKVMQR